MADVAKKSKKKKTNKRASTSAQIVEHHEVKSKRQKVKQESDDEDHHETHDDAIAGWTQEDLNQLIDNMIKELPQKDVIKYSTFMGKFDYDKIKFGHYDGEQCKAAWKHIVTKLRRYRTMTEVAKEAKEWAKRPWSSFNKPRQKHPDLPKKPLMPFFRYFMEQRDKLPKTLSTTETAKLVSKKFSELPDKKKKKYKDAYDAEMIIYRQRLEEFIRLHPEENQTLPKRTEGPEKAHTPFGLFKLSKIKDKLNAGMSKKDALEEIRKLWQALDDKKRIKWIRKALSDQVRYQAELAEYLKSHPTYAPPAQKPLLTKAEKELKDKADGKPERPPPSGYNLYSRKVLKTLEGSSKEKMAKIAQLWKELSDEERAKYNFEAKKLNNKYTEEFENYLNSLPLELRAQAILESNTKSTPRKIKTDASGLVVGKKSAPKKPTVQPIAIAFHQGEEEDDEDEDEEEEEEEENESDEEEDSDSE